MKKLISLVFTLVLSLAVLNVMAIDKNSKKLNNNTKLKTVKSTNKTKSFNSLTQAKTPDGKIRVLKAVTIDDLKKIKQKAAQK